MTFISETCTYVLESGMRFIYDEYHTFMIEKYVQEKKFQCVKTVEFIKKQKNLLIFVEAKTSAPKPGSKEYENFVCDIVTKAEDSLLVFLRLFFEQDRAVLKNAFLDGKMRDTQFCFILVVRDHKCAWLDPLTNHLRKTMRHIFNAWRWGNVPLLILNKKMAVEKGLVLPEEPQVSG